jgi:hypothetical protein
LEIRRELSQNPSVWKSKEIIDIIHKKTVVLCTMKFISTKCFTSEGSLSTSQESDLSTQHQIEKEFKKGLKRY